MKIACIGNMNNAFFSLCRYLRDQGMDAHLLTLSSEPAHFAPEADSYTDEYKKYTHALNWSRMPYTFRLTKKQDILNAIKGYDFIIACDAAPAYLSRVGRDVDLFIPYGSDIYFLPHFNLFEVPLRKARRYYLISKFQRRAIKSSRFVSLDSTNLEFERRYVDTVPMNGKRLKVTCPFIYCPQYENGEMEAYAPNSDLFSRFKRIREAHELVVFQHGRQEWEESVEGKPSTDITMKGNDKLIRGYAAFIKSYPQVKAALVLFEYGTCVDKSKNLINELGIGARVFWLPLSLRKDIMLCISLIDVAVGELNMSWLSYGAILEYMALKKPVMHFRDDTMYQDKTLYPMIHASTAQQVSEGILRIYLDKKESTAIGAGSYRWFKEHAIEKPLHEYIALIKGKNPD